MGKSYVKLQIITRGDSQAYITVLELRDNLIFQIRNCSVVNEMTARAIIIK